MKFYACNEELFHCERLFKMDVVHYLVNKHEQVWFSNLTSGGFCLILPVEV